MLEPQPTTAPETSATEYEAPKIEIVITPEELSREVDYAGRPPITFIG
jgi:hypothetical protein